MSVSSFFSYVKNAFTLSLPIDDIIAVLKMINSSYLAPHVRNWCFPLYG